MPQQMAQSNPHLSFSGDLRHALERTATGQHHWHPDNRETADHSVPYVVLATL